MDSLPRENTLSRYRVELPIEDTARYLDGCSASGMYVANYVTTTNAYSGPVPSRDADVAPVCFDEAIRHTEHQFVGSSSIMSRMSDTFALARQIEESAAP
jgi:hypothetical protein